MAQTKKLYHRVKGMKDYYYIEIPAVFTKGDVRKRNWKFLKASILRHVRQAYTEALTQAEKDLKKRTAKIG